MTALWGVSLIGKRLKLQIRALLPLLWPNCSWCRCRTGFQPGCVGKREGRFFHGKSQAKIHHGLVPIGRYREWREQKVRHHASNSADKILPEAVAGVLRLHRGQRDFHFRRARFMTEGQHVDPRHDFIFKMNGTMTENNVMQADDYGAGTIMAVEPQPHFGDDGLAVGQRTLDFDAAVAGTLNVDGIELIQKRFAGMEFLFVLPDTIGVVKNIPLQAFADKFKFAGSVKGRAVGPAIRRNHPGALRIAGVGGNGNWVRRD